MKQQSKLTMNGNHISYDNCDSYSLKQDEVVMDKPKYVGFAILEKSNLHMYETYYDNLQPYFGQKSLESHYIDTDGMIFSMRTQKINKDLKNVEDILEFN